jgi:hypothetical protein
MGQGAEVAGLNALSGKKRRVRLEAIRDAYHAYIAGPLTAQFTHLAASVIPEGRFRLEPDLDDKDGQSLLFWYPAVTASPETTSAQPSRLRPVPNSHSIRMSQPRSHRMSQRICPTWT